MALVSVRYTGLSDIREMSVKDLAAVGVGVSGMMRWQRENRWNVFVEDPSDELLEQLKIEGTFTVTEVDEETRRALPDKTPILTADPLKADDTGSTVKDTTTGQVSKAKAKNA